MQIEEDKDASTESLEEDNGVNAAEVTVFVEEITPDSKDLSGEYSEDDNEDLQTLVM